MGQVLLLIFACLGSLLQPGAAIRLRHKPSAINPKQDGRGAALRFAAAHGHFPAHIRSLNASNAVKRPLENLDTNEPHTSPLRISLTAGRDSLERVADVRVAFITAWLDSLVAHAARINASIAQIQLLLPAARSDLQQATAALTAVATEGGDNRLAIEASNTNGAYAPSGLQNRARLNAFLRPLAVKLVENESDAKHRLGILQSRLNDQLQHLTALSDEIVSWRMARKDALESVAHTQQTDLDALNEAHAQLLHLMKLDANVQALGVTSAKLHSTAGVVQGNLSTCIDPSMSERDDKAHVNASRRPSSATISNSHLPSTKLSAADAAAAAISAASNLVPSSTCASEAACKAEQLAFAASSTVNYQRSAAAALTIVSMLKNRLVHSKLQNLESKYEKVHAAFRQKLFVTAIALFGGKNYNHPGGVAAVLCHYIQLRLKDYCAKQVSAAMEAAKISTSDMVYCTVRSLTVLGRGNGALGQVCKGYFRAIGKNAKQLGKGMFEGLSSAKRDLSNWLKEIAAASKDAARSKAAAIAVLQSTAAPFAFPSSPAEANLLALEYMYWARKDAYYMFTRAADAAVHRVKLLTSRANLDFGSVIAGGNIPLPPESDVRKAIDAAVQDMDSAKSDAKGAEAVMQTAEQELLAAQGRAPLKQLSSPPPPSDKEKPDVPADPPNLSCPPGNVFCPALPGRHADFWEVFNQRKGSWKPKEDLPDTWKGSDELFADQSSFVEVYQSPQQSDLTQDGGEILLEFDTTGDVSLESLSTISENVLLELRSIVAPLSMPAPHPDAYPDLYPDLYYPPTSPATHKQIRDTVDARDAGQLGTHPAPVSTDHVRPRNQQPDDDENALPSGSADVAASVPRGPSPPPHIKAGDRVIVTLPQAPWKGALAAFLPPKRPSVAEGYVTREYPSEPSEADLPREAFDVTLQNGKSVRRIPIANVAKAPVPQEPTSEAPSKGSYKVDADMFQAGVWPPAIDKSMLDQKTKPIPKKVRKCWLFGLLCRTVTVKEDPPVVKELKTVPLLANAALKKTPAELLYLAVPDTKCDCLCPIPSNKKLNARDCGDLARQIVNEKKAEDLLSTANGDVFEASNRFRLAQSLAEAAQLIAGPKVSFMDVDPEASKAIASSQS